MCLRRKPLFFTRSPGPRLISPPGANWRTGVRLERAVCLCCQEKARVELAVKIANKLEKYEMKIS